MANVLMSNTKLTESQIREAISESGKMRVNDMLAYLEFRFKGRYDKKLARSNAKEICAEIRKYTK